MLERLCQGIVDARYAHDDDRSDWSWTSCSPPGLAPVFLGM